MRSLYLQQTSLGLTFSVVNIGSLLARLILRLLFDDNQILDRDLPKLVLLRGRPFFRFFSN